MNEQEQRDYARGYNAGRKKTEAEMEKSAAEWAVKEAAYKSLRAQFAGQIMAGLMTANDWEINGKKATDMKDRAKLARIGADNLMSELKL